MSPYSNKPHRFLERLYFAPGDDPIETLCCAGFELQAWRCKPLAKHLIEWLPDYALTEEELNLHHGEAYDKLCQAAVRVYTSHRHETRGEAGEIALHAICRDYFSTIPISPRVFYQSASNDVVKAFDMVHARFEGDQIEIWLGEAKLYQDRDRAIADAIKSVRKHIEGGFLTNQKLLLGPQIPKTTPRYEEVRAIFRSQTSLDTLLNSAVIAIGIICDSDAVTHATQWSEAYRSEAAAELSELAAALRKSPLFGVVRINLIYLPLLSKQSLVDDFDKRLKGLTDDS